MGRSAPAGRAAIALALFALVQTTTLRAAEVTEDQEEPRPRGPVETIEVRDSAEGPAALDPTAFATVIRAEEFEGRVTSVPELLREAVGVQVSSLGGEFATVSIRGSSAEQVIVYLDGVPLNRALGEGVNLADLPLGQVESIEIYRGFTPAGLPAASIGGAVLIHTRRPEGAKTGTASLAFGSFRSAEAIASLSGSRAGAVWTVGVDGATTRGDFEFEDNNGTPHEARDDELNRRVNNDSRRAHLAGRCSLEIGSRTRINVSTDLFRRERGVPGIEAHQSENARFGTSRELLRTELETPGLLGGRLLARGALDYTRYAEAFEDRDSEVGLGEQRTDHQIGSLGQEFGLVLAATHRQAASLLLSRRRETADLENRALEPADLGMMARTTTVATLEDQVSLLRDRVLLNPSLRHERYVSNFRRGAAPGLVSGSTFGEDAHTTGKVGFRLRAAEHLTIKGNLGRFVRLPDLTEQFGDRGSVIGNPALLPERGRSIDLGLSASLPRPGGVFRLAQVEAILFETVAEDLILFSQNSPGTVKAENFSRARIRGAELTLAFALGSRFAGSLNATLQRATDRSGSPTDGNRLPGRPSQELSATAGLNLGRGRLHYEFNYVGRNFVDAPNTTSFAIPARYLHDLGYRLDLSRGLRAVLEVKNIGDELTYDVARFPLPGRSVHGRLAWEF
jgi:outer membrane cobalamin receptor